MYIYTVDLSLSRIGLSRISSYPEFLKMEYPECLDNATEKFLIIQNLYWKILDKRGSSFGLSRMSG